MDLTQRDVPVFRFVLCVSMFAVAIAVGTTGCRGWLEKRAKAKQEKIEMEQRQAQASNLVQQAEGLLKEQKESDAENTIRQALEKDSTNLRGQELLAGINRGKAAVALAEAKKLDPGQGFGEIAGKMDDSFVQAGGLLESGNFSQASDVYMEICKRAEVLRVSEVIRQESLAVKKASDDAKASCVSIDAAADAPEQWSDAVQVEAQALAVFEKASFAEASTNWTQSAQIYNSALEWAKGVQSVRVAKAAYDKDLIAAAGGPLEQYGGVPWEHARQAASAAEELGKGAKWTESVTAWQDARAKLAAAMKFAIDAEEAERQRKLMEEAIAKHGSLMRLAKEQIRMSQSAQNMSSALKFVKVGAEEIKKAVQEDWYRRLPVANLAETKAMTRTLEIRRFHILFPDLDEVENSAFAKVEDLAAGSSNAVVEQMADMQKLRLPLEAKSRITGMQFRLVPSGAYLAGKNSKEPGEKDETPQHAVTISRAFYMANCEVTQSQWKHVTGNSKSSFSEEGSSCPAENVSWGDASWFCDRMSAVEGVQRGCYRLPTEAEWERACRAGTKGRFYTGDKGADSGRAGWFVGNSGRQTHAVGQKQPNAYGLYDMHGNVWEWCSDSPVKYADTAVTDPVGAPKSHLRVLRGGGWSDEFNTCRSANRASARKTDDGSYDIGLRVVREVPSVID